ncbi:MAG: FapA family protein [Desulfovibrionaceae bacterium]
MSYYLQHYFDPSRDHLHLKPRQGAAENSALFDLGYVQNAIAGQVLAQLLPLEQVKNPHPRYILDKAVLPVGPNTCIAPDRPQYLLATANGYVFYYDGLITVKRLLNVRGDVNFHTGNIFFVGDSAVHGSVRAGFEIQANNILVKGMVEGGIIRARRDLAVAGGIRGGAGKHCLAAAGGKLTSMFVEKAEIRAQDTVQIKKYCLHSTIYSKGNCVVQGRLSGGTINANASVYITEQLGNNAAVPTRVYLGYDPMRIRILQREDKQIGGLSEMITHLDAVAGHLPPDASDASRKLAQALTQREHLIKHRTELWTSLHLDEQFASRCCLVVPGKVFPGVEVAIGRTFLAVDRPYTNVIFRLIDDEIVIEHGKTS